MRIQGKFAFVTGAAQRIGREIAITLAKHGAGIIIHYNRSRTAAVSLKDEIQELGGEAVLLASDLSSKKKPLRHVISRMIHEVYQRVPRVDILINNASVFYRTAFGSVTENDWDNLLTVNLKAPFFLSQEIGKKMFSHRSGKIINIVDPSVFRPSADYIPYAVSKSGLMTATRGLAKALAPYVHVNSIAPGPILPSRGMTKKDKARVIHKTLLKRFGNPEDIAETVRFLIEGTDFITGAMIPVDGGSSIA